MKFLRFLISIVCCELAMCQAMTANAQGTVVMAGRAVQVAVTPTVTASSAYSAGNVVGQVMTFPVFRSKDGASGVLASVLLVDRANQKQAMTLLLFSKNPTNGTYTDKSALALDSTDAVSLVRCVSIATTDYVTVGAYAVADIGAIGKVAMNSELTASGVVKHSLYGVLVTGGTPTFNAATNVTVKVGLLQD